jgi:hypothetical protein
MLINELTTKTTLPQESCPTCISGSDTTVIAGAEFQAALRVGL